MIRKAVLPAAGLGTRLLPIKEGTISLPANRSVATTLRLICLSFVTRYHPKKPAAPVTRIVEPFGESIAGSISFKILQQA